jgi:hypothetical protein
MLRHPTILFNYENRRIANASVIIIVFIIIISVIFFIIILILLMLLEIPYVLKQKKLLISHLVTTCWSTSGLSQTIKASSAL